MKKNKKGMTLVEVIVALALFAIMSLMIASIFSASAQLNKMTNAINKKMDMQIAVANVYGTTAKTREISPSIIQFKIDGKEIPINVKVYEIDKDKEASDDDAKSKINSNIKYFVFFDK